jgi:2-C-methyl-D-erythritol 4-phosphate cytidylyltransferase/2-C-methyl-D-erythritol 2,4-cyclodiphosphate synthase
MSLFLILLAAGDSKRLNLKAPKPYQEVNNIKVLEHALNAFRDIKQIKKTIIVYNNKHKKYLKKLSLKNILKITGGKTRQESTLRALKLINKKNCSRVLIHDAARPNPSRKLINNVIFHLKKNDAVIPVIKVTDSVKRIKDNIIFKNIKRDSLRFAQTPQGFNYKKIYKKHLKNINNHIDDDATLFTNDLEKVFVIKGSKENLKITDKDDLKIFKSFKIKKNYVGIGFDVHRLVPKRKLYLGGLNIKSRLGTLGHSDGDPVLHSIIDAILGACRMGDIGEEFSDTNKKFKNIRSTYLVKKIINKIKLKGYFINNIDINIITQTPKIKKYKKKIIENISILCKIPKKQINVKGKTTEKLGVIGKEKAIAAESIVSVINYD